MYPTILAPCFHLCIAALFCYSLEKAHADTPINYMILSEVNSFLTSEPLIGKQSKCYYHKWVNNYTQISHESLRGERWCNTHFTNQIYFYIYPFWIDCQTAAWVWGWGRLPHREPNVPVTEDNRSRRRLCVADSRCEPSSRRCRSLLARPLSTVPTWNRKDSAWDPWTIPIKALSSIMLSVIQITPTKWSKWQFSPLNDIIQNFNGIYNTNQW